jgi:hypothetical protein
MPAINHENVFLVNVGPRPALPFALKAKGSVPSGTDPRDGCPMTAKVHLQSQDEGCSGPAITMLAPT